VNTNNNACTLEEWKYRRLAESTKGFKIYGKDGKFCPIIKCNVTG